MFYKSFFSRWVKCSILFAADLNKKMLVVEDQKLYWCLVCSFDKVGTEPHITVWMNGRIFRKQIVSRCNFRFVTVGKLTGIGGGQKLCSGWRWASASGCGADFLVPLKFSSHLSRIALKASRIFRLLIHYMIRSFIEFWINRGVLLGCLSWLFMSSYLCTWKGGTGSWCWDTEANSSVVTLVLCL